MTIYSDAYLSHYADRYVAMQLKRHGVTLEQYLANPAHYDRLEFEPFPPLPAQLRVQQQMDAEAARAEQEIEHLPRRNGAAIEVLRHRRHHRRTFFSFFTRKVKA
ncbi:hypothetical protein [Bordetella petrii]|nr:hypothetical protein [Bordetella petrii]